MSPYLKYNKYRSGLFIEFWKYLSTGPASVVVLNSYEVVNEALVKRKSNFAGRPPLTTCMYQFHVNTLNLFCEQNLLKFYQLIIEKNCLCKFK